MSHLLGYTGSNYEPLRIDRTTHTLQVIDYAHHEIHSGSNFYVVYSVASLGAMETPDDMITLDFTTGVNPPFPHLVFSCNGSAEWRLRFIEAGTGGMADPTGQLTVLNHRRDSSKTSTVVGSAAGNVNYDSTLATGGVTLWDQYLEGSGGPKAGGTSSSVRNELILKRNTRYQLSLYVTDASPATLYMDWYEHTDRI